MVFPGRPFGVLGLVIDADAGNEPAALHRATRRPEDSGPDCGSDDPPLGSAVADNWAVVLPANGRGNFDASRSFSFSKFLVSHLSVNHLIVTAVIVISAVVFPTNGRIDFDY